MSGSIDQTLEESDGARVPTGREDATRDIEDLNGESLERPDERRPRAEPEPVDVDGLVARVDALRRFLRAVEGHVGEPALVAARTVVDRAGERLERSRDHTVVALAGTTGSGKSSIFNALAGLPLSPVGVRRPTTSVAHACAWGSDGAAPLLDWLSVPPNRRFDRESALDGDELAPLRGLVLLDLPDFDSIEASHRSEVDRLLRLVDLVVWVLDPQKYADGVVHERYLRPAAAQRDITLVVLNQVDTLRGDDTEHCLADLRRLLDADGLTDVPLLATSAVADGGLEGLRAALETGVAAHEAYLWRLAGDLKRVGEELSPLVAVEASEELVDRHRVRRLVETMAAAAGVPAIVDGVERRYLRDASEAIGWLVPRWFKWLLPDRHQRFRLGADERGVHAGEAEPDGGVAVENAAGSGGGDPDRDASAGGGGERALSEGGAAQRAFATLAARELAGLAAGSLPVPWPTAAVAAALAHQHDVPAATRAAIARTDLAVSAAPAWWRSIGVAQWLTTLAALGGLLWLLAYAAASFFAGGVPFPRVGPVPVPLALLSAGLLLGLSLWIAVLPLVRLAARGARERAERRLRSSVAEVASDLVVARVRAVLRAYSEAREALAKAR